MKLKPQLQCKLVTDLASGELARIWLGALGTVLGIKFSSTDEYYNSGFICLSAPPGTNFKPLDVIPLNNLGRDRVALSYGSHYTLKMDHETAKSRDEFDSIIPVGWLSIGMSEVNIRLRANEYYRGRMVYDFVRSAAVPGSPETARFIITSWSIELPAEPESAAPPETLFRFTAPADGSAMG